MPAALRNEDARTILAEALVRPLEKAEALALFHTALADKHVMDMLCQTAAQVRDELMTGREVQEAAFNSVSPCELKPLCLYCPYWRDAAKRPMSVSEALEHVRFLEEQTEVRQFHLSGGSKPAGDNGHVLEMVQAIHDAGFTDMRMVVNCGPTFSDEALSHLRECGVVRVFSVFETCDSDLFAKLKPGDNLAQKKDFAARIAQAGLELGTGLMAGLGPQEGRIERSVDALFQIGSLSNLSCLYLSKFRHANNIVLNDYPECPLDEALCFVALARLVLRGIHVRAAAGWRPEEQEAAWNAGAGSIRISHSFSPSSSAWC